MIENKKFDDDNDDDHQFGEIMTVLLHTINAAFIPTRLIALLFVGVSSSYPEL